MELGEAVVLGVLDDDHIGVGDVDADFDDGSGDEDLDAAGGKVGHDAVFLGGGEFAVEQADAVVGEKGGEFFELALDGGEGLGSGWSGAG